MASLGQVLLRLPTFKQACVWLYQSTHKSRQGLIALFPALPSSERDSGLPAELSSSTVYSVLLQECGWGGGPSLGGLGFTLELCSAQPL